ncbi:MAG TPA: hypothetical protein VFA60_03410 [Terriglobales bacterium]|nr:hypothetical protein [Terriglobales bacterium]
MVVAKRGGAQRLGLAYRSPELHEFRTASEVPRHIRHELAQEILRRIPGNGDLQLGLRRRLTPAEATLLIHWAMLYRSLHPRELTLKLEFDTATNQLTALLWPPLVDAMQGAPMQALERAKRAGKDHGKSAGR